MLDDDNKYGVDESAVVTFAERLYEAGFGPDESVAVAWAFVDFLFELGAI